MTEKTLFLGIGNSILSDDGVGIRVIEEIRTLVGEREGIDFDSGNVNSFRLIDMISGYQKVVIIDAIRQGGKIGTLYKISPEQLEKGSSGYSLHTIDIGSLISFKRKIGERLAEEISIYGVEVKDTETFSENLTPAVEMQIPRIAREIIENEGIPYG
jgi:hydrogenase maturation protease